MAEDLKNTTLDTIMGEDLRNTTLDTIMGEDLINTCLQDCPILNKYGYDRLFFWIGVSHVNISTYVMEGSKKNAKIIFILYCML